MAKKPKMAVYWAASCGGCEISIVNLHERFLELDNAFDIVFCPCLMDSKVKDVQAMPDGSITVTLFNGAVRTEENEEMARLLRRKSRALVAFGSCSFQGGIPALSNFHTREEHMKAIFLENDSLGNSKMVIPQCQVPVAEGTLYLPAFFEKVKTLAQVVDVDYFMPGCPPEPEQIWNVVQLLASGHPLPPKGSVIGAGASSVCDECSRTKSEKKIKKFHRSFEIEPDHDQCLLEQGIVCMGVATRSGCGAPCPEANMPCTGCYGPPEGVHDQGAKMIGALGAVLDLGDYKELTPEQLSQKVDELLDHLPDCVGTFYRYSAAGSILGGKTE